ncbi:MAG TPA: hypothetical protein PK317_00580 [Coprothermobacter proteolyticus]|nr:hypothetical protein [Coprothermobacter proteolyticus]
MIFLEFVLYSFLSLYLLWVFYLAVMNLKRGKEAGTLTTPGLFLGYPVLLVGYAIDIFVQVVVGTVFFLDLPRETTLTGRLKRYINGPSGWREKVAAWMCQHLLNQFDPDGKHC